MDDDGGLSMRHWPYYEPQLRGNLGLQLMPSTVDRDRKPLHLNGPFLRRDEGVPEPSVPMNFVRDGWIHQNNEKSKMIHMLSVNHQHQQQEQQHQHQHQMNYGVISDPPAAHTVQMLHHQEQLKNDKSPAMEKPNGANEASLKKRSQGRPPNSQKTPKPKKPKRAAAPKDESSSDIVSQRQKGSRKSVEVHINGISYDLSQIPTPVCTCTGNPQQCYRWGVGGWQSACCTTSVSMYPLPMNTKRRGPRIAGRKMSQGAFTKVLEKLAGEDGYNLSNPIDLKPYWAKHGTNKFVTIR